MKKRIISLLLCLCMVFSLLPTAVLAADGEDPDTSVGSGQVMQQDSEKPGDQKDLGDLKNSEDSDDLKNSEDSDDLKDSEDSDDSDALQLLGEGLGSELSGNCGATEADHVTWELTDDDGDGSYTLTISGNGAMKDYTSQAGETVADPTGWYALKDSITEIKIEEGVTYLGNWAFSCLTNVVKVNIPASITSLGDNIFRGDTALTTVEWASGFNAPEITDTDSNSATYIGNYVPTSMFDGCTSLGSGEELSTWLPASFTGVGCAAFRGTQFTVDFDGWNALNYIGAYGFAGMPNLDSFTLSNGIRLGLRGGASNAFNSSGLKSLTVADGISEIPSGLCNGCEQLSSVVLADFVTTIATNAFFNTKALKEIVLKNVQTINSYAFWGSGLTALVLPKSVKTVGSRAFEACTSLTKVTINAAELTLDNNNTFAGCSALSTVVTSADSKINGLNTGAFGPDSHGSYVQAPVENIEINGTVDTLNFSTLASLKSLKINGKNTWYGNILPSGFENLVINGDSWSVDHYQFQSGAHVKHLVVSAAEVSDNADNEGKTEAAFRSNFNLETAQFTGKTVKLQAKMFLGCTNLKWLDLSAVDTLTVGSGCFGDDNNENYEVVPGEPNKFNEDCVIYAKDAAAAQTLRGSGSGLDKKGIVLIVNGGTVDVTAATAGFGAVSWEGFTAQWYEEGGIPVTGEPETGKTYYVQWTKGRTTGSCGATGNEDNVSWTLAYNGDGYTLSITGKGAMADYTCNITGSDATQPWRESETGVEPTEITRVVVGDGVTNIGKFACDGLSQVKEYNIAASVADIGEWGVCGQNAEAYKLHDSTHYVVTEDGVLMSADEKTLVSYPGGKDAVDEYAIPNTVKTILPGAFVGIDAKKVVIPKSVTKFPRFSFGGSAVEEIEFNANVDKLERGAFSGLKNLNSFVFGSDTTVSIIDNEAFADLSNLTEITFPDSLTKIGDQAFKVLPGDGAAAPNLKKVTFGKGMSTIGSVVFLRQSALEVIDMTHCEQSKLTAVGEFNSRNYDDNITHPYTTTPIVYTTDADDAKLVQLKNGTHLIYAVTNGGTFPADTVFETGKLAKPEKDDCLFLGWYKNADFSDGEVTTFAAGETYYAKWMDHIPDPTKENIEFNGKGTVYVKCDIYGTHAEPIAYGNGEYEIVRTSDTTANLVFTSATYLTASKYANDHALAAVSDPEVSTQIEFKDGKWQQLKNGPTVQVRCKVTLTYDAHAPEGKPVTNMPDPLKVTQTLDEGSATTFYLSNNIPACEGYVFLGWTSDTTLDVPTIPVEWKTENNGANWKTTTGYPGYTLYAVWQKLTPVYAYMQPTHKGTALTSKDAKITAALKDLGFEEGFNLGKKYVTIGKTETDKTDLNDVSKQVTDEIDNGTFAAYEKVHATTAVLAKIDWNELKLVDDAEHKGYTDDGKIEGYHLNGTLSFCDVQFKPNGDNVRNMPADVYHLQYTDIALATPTREGYTFKGWSVQEDKPTVLDASNGAGTLVKDSFYVRNDTIFTAQWEAETYTITYEYNDKDIKNKTELRPKNPNSYTIEDAITLKPIEAAGEHGKQFVEWRCDLNKDGVAETITKIPKGTTGNLTISAHWNYPVNYTVFDKNGDKIDSLSKTVYVFEEDFEEDGYELKALTQDGYTFDGWYQDDDDLGKTEKLIKDQTLKTAKKWELYGKLTPKEYTVTFDPNAEGASVAPTSQLVTFDAAYGELPTPTREGYTFEGWYLSKTEFTPANKVEATTIVKTPGDHMLYANWAANTYTVTFNPNADDATVAPTSQLVTFDAAYGELPTPTRENYRFVGWYLNGVIVTKDTIVKTAANHTLLAGWSRSYYALTINYVDRNGKKLEKSYEASVALGADFSVTSPDVKGYKLRDKDDAVIEGTMTAAGYTYDVVYVKKSSGGSSVQIESPNKPKQDNSLKFNTEDHFAYVNGYPDGTVKPTGDVTRAEVAAILYRVMDADCVKTYETTRCSFSDVVRGDWFNLYVATLENADVIVDTRTNGKFRPNEAITRAELAAMLAQFADIKSAANSFNDVSARHWASDEIAVCAKMGWINGYPDGSFRPDATITRAEMMAMINRALGRTPKSADDLLSGMKTWRDNANVNAWYYLDVQEATNSHTYTKSGSHETWKKLR